jgi:CYTH domain-containing protein
MMARVSALTSIDPTLATLLGFPKPEYTAVERERRWLCAAVPRDQISQTLTVTDLYVQGTRLRLRDMRPSDGGPPLLKLSRKADVDARTRLITTIYLPEAEFALLATALEGARLVKTRHRLHAPSGVVLSVDEFHGSLAGLILAEAEFQSDEALKAFSSPAFAVLEVTDDPEYTGGRLAHFGRPQVGARGRADRAE